jgi:hypothetical protein
MINGVRVTRATKKNKNKTIARWMADFDLVEQRFNRRRYWPDMCSRRSGALERARRIRCFSRCLLSCW